MKKRHTNSTRASVLQITFSAALIFAAPIWLALAAPTNPKEASGPGRLGVHSQGVVATPTLGNYPGTSLPLSTDTTVTPDAAPTDTTSINVSTSSDFDGTLTGDPTTGVVRVTDAHPAGIHTVTVTAFDSDGATATKTFTLTVTTPVTCNPVSFAPATGLAAGDFPNSVAVGDFNRDGKQDLAVANYGSDNVSILLGDGGGNFSAATNFPVGDVPYSVAVGDFNRDGKQDLAVANYGSDNVSILLGDGTGHFGASTNFSVGNTPRSVAVGDFNRDGKQDLAAANIGSDNVSILLGDGTGHFSAPTNLTIAEAAAVAVGDFNGDGSQDLAVVANGFSNNVSIFLGDGAGHFSAPINFTASFGLLSVAVGDFNGDGNQDLAVANGSSHNVSTLLGDGTGHFSAATNFIVGVYPREVAVGDFNGDGNQDLAVANAASNNVSILLGDGTGHFRAPINLALTVLTSPQSVAVGDFNGDGNQDLAVANYSIFYEVAIWLRDCPVSQITPAETTCSQFASGTAQRIDSLQYRIDPDSQLISSVKPRGFLYWVPVTAAAGNNTFAIAQTITTGNFSSFFTVNGNGTNVFDSDCVALQRRITQSGDTVTVTFNAPTAGTYFIAIKYDPRNLIGEPAPTGLGRETVHYDFMTIGVPDSTSGLDLVKH